ncbi:MAG: hypothetical protein DBX39_04765 [Bacillota bacterium]|nr:MAG: hypothetical protein DBX39_04765 [Bacillota bacterium]
MCIILYIVSAEARRGRRSYKAGGADTLKKQRKALILPPFSLFYMIFPYFNKILYIVYIEKN